MISVPVSVGELVDKITILEIKAERIADEDKRENVLRELSSLRAVRERASIERPGVIEAANALKAVNEALWEIEDAIREQERRASFGDEFIALARSVYRKNDERAQLKRRINELTGSELTEEKSYASYV